MILIISKKDDLISYGFYNAYRTIYKDVKMIERENELDNLEYKIVIVNNYNFYNDIKVNKKTIYILINEHVLFENKLKNNNVKYFIIKEYSSLIDITNFEKIEKYCYKSNNLILMPFCSIFTKNQILWHYKKNLIIKKNIPKNIISYDNTTSISKELIHLNYTKSNIKHIKTIIDKLYNEKNIYLTNYNGNKIDYKAISYMALGNYVMTKSKIDELYTLKLKDDIKKINLDRIVQNIEIIYNDLTFEKYIKILNNYFLLSV